jgi:hypothetical protein
VEALGLLRNHCAEVPAILEFFDRVADLAGLNHQPVTKDTWKMNQEPARSEEDHVLQARCELLVEDDWQVIAGWLTRQKDVAKSVTGIGQRVGRAFTRSSMGTFPGRSDWTDQSAFTRRGRVSGYARACPPGVKLVGVRVRKDSTTKLYREGKWPVVRGTFWKVDDRSGYLWASGFKASVLSYDGWEMPVPLRIDIEHGEASVELVARDILGLTKLNYNACKVGDAAPVTVGFSDAVGEILVSNPTIKNPRPNFKFYI